MPRPPLLSGGYWINLTDNQKTFPSSFQTAGNQRVVSGCLSVSIKSTRSSKCKDFKKLVVENTDDSAMQKAPELPFVLFPVVGWCYAPHKFFIGSSEIRGRFKAADAGDRFNAFIGLRK